MLTRLELSQGVAPPDETDPDPSGVGVHLPTQGPQKHDPERSGGEGGGHPELYLPVGVGYQVPQPDPYRAAVEDPGRQAAQLSAGGRK